MDKPSKQTFACSKSATEILEEIVNMFKFNNKDTQTTSLTLNFVNSIIDCEHAFVLDFFYHIRDSSFV